VEEDGIQDNGNNGQAPEPAEEATDGQLRTDAVSKVYAEALMEMAEASGELQSMADEVEELGQLLKREPGLMGLLSSRTLSHEQRREMLQRLFQDQLSDVLYRFVQVVNDKNRLASLPAIVKAFGQQMAERNGIVEADIWVPKLLEQDQLDAMSERIASAFGAKQVVIHQYKDQSLIGGLKIRVGDTLIDGSVATQLRRMRRRMIESGREKARQQTEVEA
jgi:F-type H+-transporting ATPase subunit delta